MKLKALNVHVHNIPTFLAIEFGEFDIPVLALQFIASSITQTLYLYFMENQTKECLPAKSASVETLFHCGSQSG